MPDTICHICHAAPVKFLPRFAALRRVTSDAKPWPAGGTLGVCPACGTVQKSTDETWHRECASIYRDYTIYHNAGGAEQQVFADGAAMSRSARLVEKVRDHVGLSPRGRLLDVGCGNGALLRSFSRLVPGWSLAGSELNDKYKSAVEAIPGVERLYTCPLEQIPGSFDAITLLHCLEHVPDPVAFLKLLQGKLNPGGLLIVEVPDHLQNPFDLLIADHCSHFSKASLGRAYAAAGVGVVASADDWIAKELTVVGRRGESCLDPDAIILDAGEALAGVEQRVEWLASLPPAALHLQAHGPLGVFGTSIAGTWLGSELGDAVQFYVDEDASRQGNTLNGRPIIAPAAVPAGGQVFLGLSPVVARAIKKRMDAGAAGRAWHLPPAIHEAA